MSDDGTFEVETFELSRAGRAHRDRMLVELQGIMVERRVRRRVVRATAFATAATLAAVALWRALLPATPTERAIETPPSAPVAAAPTAAPAPAAAPRFENIQLEVVGVDPTVLKRFACEPMAADHIERIDDRELMQLLAAANRPTGLIRLPAPPASPHERPARVILTAIPHDDSPDRVALDQLPEIAPSSDPAG